MHQSILVPVVDKVPHAAIAYARLMSEAYCKPISFLCLDTNLYSELETYDYSIVSSDLSLDEALSQVVESLDAVMVIFQLDRRRRTIFRQLQSSRDLRIPYFFIPEDVSLAPPRRIVLPVSFYIEDREKAVWARSLHRVFQCECRLLKPADKGSRAAKNVIHIETFFQKHSIPFLTKAGRLSSFKNDKEALTLFSDWAHLIIVTASREYGLDDSIFGPKELHLLRKAHVPVMVLNPRDDLYILCGD